jgi:hypothetical protein
MHYVILVELVEQKGELYGFELDAKVVGFIKWALCHRVFNDMFVC